MSDNSVGRGAEDCKALAEAAETLRSAFEDVGREVAIAALEGDELPTTDPEVLVEAIFQTSQMAAAYWAKVVDDAAWMVDDRDAHRADEARYVIRRMAEVADTLLDELASEVEA